MKVKKYWPGVASLTTPTRSASVHHPHLNTTWWYRLFLTILIDIQFRSMILHFNNFQFWNQQVVYSCLEWEVGSKYGQSGHYVDTHQYYTREDCYWQVSLFLQESNPSLLYLNLAVLQYHLTQLTLWRRVVLFLRSVLQRPFVPSGGRIDKFITRPWVLHNTGQELTNIYAPVEM